VKEYVMGSGTRQTSAHLAALVGVVIAIVSIALAAPAAQTSGQQQPPTPRPRYEPKVGMPGKDSVWVPTPMAVVEKMLDVAKVAANDVVIDLGSGDGRNVIAAAKRGARAIGFEFNPDLVELSRERAVEAGVADRTSFVEGDMFAADISKATVLALFLLPSNLERLQDKILALRPGTRMVVNTFTVPSWEPDEIVEVTEGCQTWCTVLLHIVPARVEGLWRGGDAALSLDQEFQMVDGTMAVGGKEVPIESGRLLGDRLMFRADGVAYDGRVDGTRITGTATRQSTGARESFTFTRGGVS
jgi:SAM-dependent methyltransferase